MAQNYYYYFPYKRVCVCAVSIDTRVIRTLYIRFMYILYITFDLFNFTMTDWYRLQALSVT